MAGEAELEGLDPFDLLDAESLRVERYLSSAPDWARPSRCAGWTTRDVLSHLLGVEDYNRACLDDGVAGLFARAAQAGASDLDSFNAWVVDRYGALPAGEALDRWRAANAAFRAEMRARGAGGTVATSVGPYPVGLQAFHLAQEYATHGDDVGVPVDPSDRSGRVAWRARFARFAVAELDKPVEIDVAVPGRNRVRAGGEEADIGDDELVEASQGRLPAGHPLSPALRQALNTMP